MGKHERTTFLEMVSIETTAEKHTEDPIEDGSFSPSHHSEVKNIPSNFRLALFSCFCCFFPIGIFALLASYITYRRKIIVDVEGARVASNIAFNLSVAAITAGTCMSIFLLKYFQVSGKAGNRDIDSTQFD
mmetsp:Transcript_18962/g.26704  ORF Transcript_18962/g.26704 Transcript_18962/m.26704 type:complete len:131 (-) Transcript_18962:47-439(-)